MKTPQLSLRELFLLVALAAMGCGWWADRATIALTLQAETVRAQSFEQELSKLRRQLELADKFVNDEKLELNEDQKILTIQTFLEYLKRE